MAYIGIQPAEKFTSFATQEFSTSATTSYTLDHAVANENEIALFVNNVRQQPGSGKAYTATGTALTLSAATASTDTMYCVFLGRALQTVVPATNSITNAMITDSTIESGKLFSTFKNGITSTDQYRLTANLENPGSADITANIERADDATFGGIGTGMSVSSGIYTFPSTGIWRIQVIGHFYDGNGDDGAASVDTLVSSDSGSNYDILTSAIAGNLSGSQSYNTHPSECFVDVTNASNFRVKFRTDSMTATILVGSSNQNVTSFSFIRLGDT